MLAPKTIITVVGGRRVGKSVVVRQFIRHLIEEEKIAPQRIFYANLFMQELDPLKSAAAFTEALAQWKKRFAFAPGERLFIIIDEVQEIPDWEKLVGSLYEDYTTEYKLILTGSNAKLLGGELHTYLAGRSFEPTVYPLSFEEFASFHGRPADRAAAIDYLTQGGMPELIPVTDPFARRNLIEATIDSIIMRDIAARHDLRNIPLLKKIVDYLGRSAADEVSKGRMVNLMKNGGERISINTVVEYLEYLKEAFFFHECPLYSHKKSDTLKNLPLKVYLNDPAFARRGNATGDFGKLLENVVYIELRRRGFTVSTLRVGDKEVDFLAEKGIDRRYLQVAYTIGDDESELFRREFDPLLAIKDHYPKYVLSLDELSHAPVEGVRHLSVVDMLRDGLPQG